MKAFGLLPNVRSPRSYLLGLLVLLSVLTLSACGGVNSVGVYDNAGVLNASQVKKAASNLPNNVDIYTTNTFNGTRAEFQRAAASKLGGDPNRIVMAIDTVNHYTYIARGSNVPLSGAGIAQAVGSFASNYNNGDYTKATVAALGSMNSALSAKRGPTFSPILVCCLPLLLLSLIPVLLKIRGSRFPGLARGFGPQRGPYQQPPQAGYPYDQGGYGPQGGYGYGPPPQRGGMNPWAAGGLGAAAGGLAGYELGRHQGERDNDAAGGGGDFGGGGNFGNSGDNFGGGGSFGNGGDNFGGGGGFGNGGDNFGGGGSFGNGGDNFGGGGDFGNGGGGNF